MRWLGWGTLVALIAALTWAPHAEAFPSSTPDAALAPNGPVTAIARAADGRVYLGGDFTRMAPHTGSLGLVSTTTSERDAQFPRIEGVVNTIVSDGASGWFVGGRFTQVGGIAVANAAHIKADKTVDTAWKPDPSGGATTNNPTEVFAIAVAGSTVYIGGNFATVGGAIRTDAAAVDKTSGAVQSWAPEPPPNGAQGSVRALLASGSKVYMGGRFSGVKAPGGGPPVTRTNAAAVDATTGEAGAWIPEPAGAQNRVNTIVADGSTIYLAGRSSR